MDNQHWSPRSPVAYQSLERLAKVLFELIQKYVNLGEPVPWEIREEVSLEDSGSFGTTIKAVPAWGWLVQKKEEEIKTLPEFGKCVESMLADREAQAFVPSDEEASEYVSNQYVFPFLVQLMTRTESPEFNRLVFDNRYQIAACPPRNRNYSPHAWIRTP